jgi:hypothetical protein
MISERTEAIRTVVAALQRDNQGHDSWVRVLEALKVLGLTEREATEAADYYWSH